MSVNRIPTGTSPAGSQQAARTAADLYEAASRRRPGAPTDAGAPAPGDRVEVSAEARARLAEDAARQAEVGRARAALHALPSALTPEREAEIRQRIESGFYDQPAVTKAVAERIVHDAQGL